MAKFYGMIGFARTIETSPGVFVETVIERPYRGDIPRNHISTFYSDGINANVNISNEFSIISDSYITQNASRMRYIKYNGEYWRIRDITIQYPRLILNVGGEYNGPTASST